MNIYIELVTSQHQWFAGSQLDISSLFMVRFTRNLHQTAWFWKYFQFENGFTVYFYFLKPMQVENEQYTGTSRSN